MLTRAEIEDMITDCEKRSEKMTEYEANFIDDISQQFIERGRLSEKQQKFLEDIWERVT